jgi:hypothetical protein
MVEDAHERAGVVARAERRVSLDLRFPSALAPGEVFTVRVIVEDVGEADVRAPLLYEAVFTDVTLEADGSLARLRMSIPASAEIDTAMTPAIRVHVARGQTGTLEQGDFINPAIVPLPDAMEARCNIPLVEVR